MNSTIKAIKFTKALAKIIRTSQNSKEKENAQETAQLAKQQGNNFRKLIQSLGTTYIKFGQILSVRFDLLPTPVCEELQYLLDQGEQLDFEYVINRIKNQLGENKYKTIRTIDPSPIGVASLGQVHKAHLTNGNTVAVKVQRPGMYEQLKDDLKAIKSLLKILSIIPSIARLELPKFLNEFEFWTIRELDYTLEAQNTDQFRKNFENDLRIHAPKVYWNLTNRNILTTEYIDGFSLTELMKEFADKFPQEEIIVNGIRANKTEIMDIFAETVYIQIFKHGFAHGDPHPSNLFLTNNNEITFLDFGIVTKLSHRQIDELKEILVALATYDFDKILASMLKLDEKEGHASEAILRDELRELFGKFETSSAKEYSPTQFLFDLMYKTGQLGIQWPKYFSLFGKILAIYDGMIQEMDPTMNLVEKIQPLIEQDVATTAINKYNPQKMAAQAYNAFEDLLHLAKSIPTDGRSFINKINDEGIPVKIYNNANENHEITERYKIKLKTLSVAFIITEALIAFSFFQPRDRMILAGIDLLVVFITVSAIIGLSMIYLIVKKN